MSKERVKVNIHCFFILQTDYRILNNWQQKFIIIFLVFSNNIFFSASQVSVAMIDKSVQCDLLKPYFTTSTPVNSESDDDDVCDDQDFSYRPGESTIDDDSYNLSSNSQ